MSKLKLMTADGGAIVLQGEATAIDRTITIPGNTDASLVTDRPATSITPTVNGQVVFELTSNTTLTIKAKGSDGIVRSGTITLSA